MQPRGSSAHADNAIEKAIAAVVRRLASDPADRDDLRQQLWLHYLQHPRILEQFKGRSALSTYLFQVFMNAGINFCSREYRAQEAGYVLRHAYQPAKPQSDPALMLSLERALVSAALSLDRLERKAVFRHFYRGLPIPKLAAEMGFSARQVYALFERVYRRLRRSLTAQGYSAATLALDLRPLDLSSVMQKVLEDSDESNAHGKDTSRSRLAG